MLRLGDARGDPDLDDDDVAVRKKHNPEYGTALAIFLGGSYLFVERLLKIVVEIELLNMAHGVTETRGEAGVACGLVEAEIRACVVQPVSRTRPSTCEGNRIETPW